MTGEVGAKEVVVWGMEEEVWARRLYGRGCPSGKARTRVNKTARQEEATRIPYLERVFLL